MNAKIGINLIRTLSGHRQGIYALAANPADKSFYTSGGDGMVVRWNPLESDNGQLLADAGESVYSLAHLPDGTILCGTQSGLLISINENARVRRFEKHHSGIFFIQPLFNGNFITTGGDGMVVLWSPSFEILQEKKLSEKSVRCAVHLDQGWAFGASDSDIYLTDSEFRIRGVLRGHKESVFALEYENNILFSGGRDALLHSWDLQSERQLLPINAHLFHIHSIKKNSEKNLLATAGMDKTIKLWNLETLELLKVLDAPKFGIHTSSVNRVLWLTGDMLISVSDDRKIGVWECHLQ